MDHVRAIRRGTAGAEDEQVRLWLGWLSRRGRTESTVLNYASFMGRFIDEVAVPAGGFGAVTVHEVDAWLAAPRRGRALGAAAKPATRARNVAILRTFYRWLIESELIDSNPLALLRAPTVHNRQPKAIPDRVWQKAWGSAVTARNEPVVAVLGFGGLFGFRRAEIAALHGSHLAHHDGQVTGFQRKGGGDDVFPWSTVLDIWEHLRPSMLGSDGRAAMVELIGHHAAHDGAVLGSVGLDGINRLLRRFLHDEGLAQFTPHQLRHTFVTNLIRAGVPLPYVSELANHSDIQTTMRYVKGGSAHIAEWLDSRIVTAKTADQRSLADRFGI